MDESGNGVSSGDIAYRINAKVSEVADNVYALLTRHAEATRIREKYSDRIPVVIERAGKSDIPDIEKKQYLVQLGMAATYDTKTYCRQTLIGGNYGLLNTKTFVLNPDYYR